MEPDTTLPLSKTRQTLLIAAVMSGLLLAMLDQTIVGTALPQIVGALGGEDLYLWAVTAYLVPATVSIPVYARLSDRYGRRALLLIGMALFLAGSGLAATAQDMTQLVAWRAVQGLGAGALEGLSFILVSDLFRGERNAALQGAMAGLMGVSFIGGPLIGGFLTDHVGWEAVFTVNLPIGLAAMVVVAAVLPAHIGRSEQRRTPLDLRGIALLTSGIGLVLVGLSERSHTSPGADLPAWTDVEVGGLVLLGLLLLVAFVRTERRAAAPVIPLGLLTDRTTGAIIAAGAVGGFAMFAGVLLLPRYFQSVRDVSATHSGLLVYPLLIGLIVSVNVAGAAIMRRNEFRTPVLAGCGLAAAGAVGFATFDANTPDALSLVYMALLGLGVGPTFSGLQIAITRIVAPHMIGAAMGTLILLRQVGGAVALAAAGTVYAAGLEPDGAAAATGDAILVVGLAGTAVAAAALVALPRGASRLAPVLSAATRSA